MNLIQATFTGLLHDEAYYWVWSKHLDWGYFDHPPMIALLIKAGTIIGDTELGVRLIFVILSPLFVYLLEKLVNPKDILLFWKLLLCSAVLQLGGIIAVPDLPLMFFAMVYFLLLKKFIENSNAKNGIALGIVAALMLYSKYHGVLVIGFSLLALPKLWTKRNFWLFALAASIVFAPHLWWQYQHDFISVQYHFFERSAGDGFKIENLVGYIFGQLLFTGPLIGWLLLYFLFASKPQNETERSLKFSAIGIYVFFLIMSLKGRAEANWTNVALIPLIYFGYKEIEKSTLWTKIAHYTFIITLPLILLVRIFMMQNFLPEKMQFATEIHDWKTWAMQMKEHAREKPMIFIGSYQKTAKYLFYTKQPATCISNVVGRRNQFDLWNEDRVYYGKPAVIVFNWRDYYSDSVITSEGMETCRTMDTFVTFSPITFNLCKSTYEIKQGESLHIDFDLSHRFKTLANLNINSQFKPYISCHFYQKGEIVYEHFSDFHLTNESFKVVEHAISIPTGKLEKGNYEFRLAVSAGWLPAFVNCKKYKIKVN